MRLTSFLPFFTLLTTVLAISRNEALQKARHNNIAHERRALRPKPPKSFQPNTNLPFLSEKGSLKEFKPTNAQYNAVKQKVAKQMNATHSFAATTSDPLTGVLAAFVDPYGFVAYVAHNLTSFFHTEPLTTDLSQAAIVTLPSANPGPNFDLSIANASPSLLGSNAGYQGSHWGPGTPGYGSMTWVQHSTYPASNTNNPTGFPSESELWTLDTSTNQMTANWFNDDGTEVSCTIFYDATYGDMNFTGDLPQYLDVYPDNCYVTTLYFVPLSYFGF